MIIPIIVGWILCGVVAYGISLGYWQNEWKELASRHARPDVRMSVFMGTLGPVGLIVIFFFSSRVKHGLLWKPLGPES